MSDSTFTIGQRVVEVTRMGGQGPSGGDGPTGPAGDVARAATRTALAAIAGQAVGATRYLNEAGRQGVFEWDGSDLSAKVAADPQQGVYIAPASAPTGVSGAWVRRFNGGLEASWFGFSPSATASANVTALNAALAYLKATGPRFGGTPYVGGGILKIGRGEFSLNAAIDLFSTVRIEGEGGNDLGGYATTLKWNNTSSGFRVQRFNTEGDDTISSPTHDAGDGSMFRNLVLDGGFPTGQATAAQLAGEGERHGIEFKARTKGENVIARNWGGDGFYSNTAAGSGLGVNEGNSNNWKLIDCTAQNCRIGLFLDGADSNAGYSVGFNAFGCRQWGIWDSSFLNNTHIATHTAECGFTELSIAAYSGGIYSVVPGQEAWCSTNAPSGTSADNQGWIYLGAGAVGNRGARAWTTGLTWRAGGSFRTDNANASHVITGLYNEGGQAPCMFAGPTLVTGGQVGDCRIDGSLTPYGGYIAATGTGLATNGTLQVGNTLSGSTITFYKNGSYAGITSIFRDSVSGLAVVGYGGTTYELLLANSAGTPAYAVPVGTINSRFFGNVTIDAGKSFKIGSGDAIKGIVTLTQAAYDALGTKDPDTIYLITA